VIGDEAHYLKSPGAKRTKRAFSVLTKAPRAWLLSGTPMPNHPGELYTAFKYLWPEVLNGMGVRTSWDWFERFCLYTATIHGPRVYATKNADELNATLKRVMLRRTLQDVNLQLPPLSIDVDLLPYDHTFSEELRKIGDERDLQKLMEGEQDEGGSVSRLRRFLGEYKAPRIASILVQELKDRAYHKIVVMAYHHTVLDVLGARFDKEDIEWVGFRGGASTSDRQASIDAFMTGPARVFLAQQTAAGIAINLSAASELVLVEPDWSPDNNAQAIMRIQHITRTQPARARYFAVADTLDEAILKINARKTRMQADILPKAV
jgi:SWI/SNF-related matrix-associated actin-dependent regulator 1 of chromatin subfamily A